MATPISEDTHKQFQVYHKEDVVSLVALIQQMIIKAKYGDKTPYDRDAFLRHATANRHQLEVLADADTITCAVPANIIFWLYRGCTVMGLNCRVFLPHVCKIPTPTGEKFFVASKHDWVAHREATKEKDDTITISDHAKLQYLQRVLGINVDQMLAGFPIEAMQQSQGKVLGDGRFEYTFGDFVFVRDGNTCVTVLGKGMVTN